TYSEFLEEVKENTLTAYENQEYQFEELVDKINVRRDLSRNPIFDVMFAMQNTSTESRAIEDLEISYYDAGNKISKFDMSLNAEEAGDRILLSLEYCTKLFKKETVERLSKHYINILKAITKNQEITLGEIELISRQEKEQILEVFNNTKADYPRDKTIHELFEAQVEKTPDKVAVIYEDKQLSYRELNERANQLAVILQQKGIVPDAMVGIMAERSIEMVIGIMAILKVGGAYVPIDPEYPEDRIAYILADSDASILLTQRALKDKVQFDGDIIELEDECLFSVNKENLKPIATSKNLAYVLYTSGTTGKPKGVMIEHKSVVNITYAWKKDYKLNTFDVRLLQLASFSFDVSMGDMSRALLNGGMMVICPSHSKLDFKQLYQLISKYQISILELTPTYAIQFMEYIHTNRYEVTHIKLLILGSDSCPMEEFIKLKKQYGHSMRIINSYGLTEVTIDSSFYEDSSLENQMIGNAPIGKPMQNTMFYVLDKGGNLLPAGIAGELCIGGDGLSRGYLNKPELTAEKFVGNPFEHGKRMYRTGDLARWLPDGNVAFLGRIDYQVKVRGYRIELGEIESGLLNYDAVKEAVVIARENNGSNYLCAYIVGDKELTVTELREHLSQALPDYMLPSYFVQLQKLPLTVNGKIDKKALPEPDGSMTSGITYEAPTDAIEEKLVSIWQEILKIDKIGIRDNFFELGGHSLKATSMMAKINKELEVEIPLKEIFQGPTIKELGNKIKEKEKIAFIKIEPVEEKEYYELSSAQKRMYTLQQIEVNSTSYNMPGMLEIEGELNLERVEEAFRSLISRHEALRTSFKLIETGPVQYIHKEAAFEMEYRDIRNDNYLTAQINEILQIFIKPFDLSRAPLLRVELIRLLPENQSDWHKHILLFDMHHIISDGTSMGILVKEFGKVYNGEALKPLRIQYKDYCAWQELASQSGHYASEKEREQEQYWIEKYRGQIPVLNLPTDYPRPNIQSFEGARLSFQLDKELTGKLRKTAKQTGSTLYMVLLAGLNILLSKYSGQEDIVVGSPIAGRPHTDLENILGVFVNMLAMRNYPEGNKTIREFLQEVKENALKAYENENYQFDELVDKLNVPRDLSRNPLFDVMFVLQNEEIGEITLEGITIRTYPVEYKTSKVDISFTASEDRDKIDIDLEYCTKLYKKETAENIAYSYKAILSKITENIDVLLSEIELESSLKKAKASQEDETDFNF
ncbi:MAG: amino acid adenylation domain-containing protein, partial [Lutisporaceae bacterium]